MVVQALWQQTPLALKTEGLILTATATSTAALYFIRQGIKTQREKNMCINLLSFPSTQASIVLTAHSVYAY